MAAKGYQMSGKSFSGYQSRKVDVSLLYHLAYTTGLRTGQVIQTGFRWRQRAFPSLALTCVWVARHACVLDVVTVVLLPDVMRTLL